MTEIMLVFLIYLAANGKIGVYKNFATANDESIENDISTENNFVLEKSLTGSAKAKIGTNGDIP
jgi:hypothetical protein